MGRPTGSKDTARVEKEGGYVSSIEILGEGEMNPNIICGIDITQYKLTKAEAEFIIEYMNNGMNAMQAAMKAFNVTKPGTAKARAAFVLNSGRVFPVLQQLIKHSVSTSLQFSPGLLMENIKTWLQYDVRNYYNSSGTAIPLDEIDEDARQLISGVDYTVNSRTGERYVTYRLPDKYKALQELSSIVKFLQTMNGPVGEDEGEARAKRDAIFGKPTNFVPTTYSKVEDEK